MRAGENIPEHCHPLSHSGYAHLLLWPKKCEGFCQCPVTFTSLVMKAPDTPSWFYPQRATKSPPETELQEKRESKRHLLGVSSETWLCLQTSGCHLSMLCNHCRACQKMISGYTSRIPKSVILGGGGQECVL